VVLVFDALTDLMLVYMALGVGLGWLISWGMNAEGQVIIRSRLFKQNAKIFVQFVPGRFFKRSIILLKKPDFIKDGHEIDVGEQPPIYKPVGSGAQYIFNRYGEAGAFDPEKVETGFYEPTDEAKMLIAQSQAAQEEAKKYYADGKNEEAALKAKAAQEAYDKAVSITPRWYRQSPASSYFFGNIHRQIQSRINAEVWAGLFGQLAKNAMLLLYGGLAILLVSCATLVIVIWKLVKI
jgi:hypothetical protein